MTVYLIGAGPGAPDLITLRGRDLIARCPVVLYAGSLVPAEVVAFAPAGACVLDTAPMTLDAILAEIESAHAAGNDVARVRSPQGSHRASSARCPARTPRPVRRRPPSR